MQSLILTINQKSMSNALFLIVLLTNAMFQHTIIGQIGLIVFTLYILTTSLNRWVQTRRIDRYAFNYYITLILVFILFNAYLTAHGYATNDDIAWRMIGSLVYTIVFLWCTVIYVIYYSNIKKAMDVYVASTAIYSLYVMVISSGTIGIVRLGSESDINVNRMANMIMIAVFWLIYSAIKTNKWRKETILKIAFLLTCLLLTGTRKTILVLAIGIVLIVMLLRGTKRLKYMLLAVILGIVGLFAIFNIPFLYNLLGSRLLNLLQYQKSGVTAEASLSDRLMFINLGMEYFYTRPWTGYGLDCFKLIPVVQGRYAHNNYVELLYSGGIICCAIWYFNCGIATMRTIINKFKDEYSQGMLVLGVMLLINDIGQVSYSERSTLVIWAIIASYGLYNVRKIR